MKNSGRTALIFLILIVIVLVCGVSISLYLLQKETQGRQSAEASLEVFKDKSAKLEASLKETQKQIEVLTGKNKDADDKINSLLDEIEVEKGLREEVKKENQKVKDDLAAEVKSKLDLREKMTKDIEAAQAKLAEAEKSMEKTSSEDKAQIDDLQKKLGDLDVKNKDLEKQLKDLNASIAERQQAVARPEIVPTPGQNAQDKVELDKIVVTPDAAKEGRVLNVDSETEFLIFDLGARNGIKQGDIMSINRGKTYLGDVRVTRVQEEMAAADFVPPFSSKKVRKGDQVVPKK